MRVCKYIIKSCESIALLSSANDLRKALHWGRHRKSRSKVCTNEAAKQLRIWMKWGKKNSFSSSQEGLLLHTLHSNCYCIISGTMMIVSNR